MEVARMREAIKAVYASPRWADKVNKMPEAQVFAVYARFKRENKI